VKIDKLTAILGLSVGAGALLADRVTKIAVMKGAVRQGPAFFSWLEITIHHNFGLLGNLAVPRILILLFSLLALGVLAYGLFDALKYNRRMDFIALCLVLGGALGNLYDRVTYVYVFDWLMFFKTSIINFSDAFITIGLIMYAIGQFVRKIENKDVDCHETQTKIER
jgi:signal peptidase II